MIPALLLVFAQVQPGTNPAPRPAGFGTCFVSLADDPSALFFNPAGIAGLEGRNFLIVPRRPLQYQFVGYSQKLSDKIGVGILFLDDPRRTSVSFAGNVGKGRVGLSLGKQDSAYRHFMFDLGLLYPRLAFKEIPGAASFGLAAHLAPDWWIQFGVGYTIKMFKLMAEPQIIRGRPLRTHLGLVFTIPVNRFFKNIELGVGYNGDSLTFGFNFDFSDLRIDAGYGSGRFQLAALLRTRVREREVIAEIVTAAQEKDKEMSKTYLDQGIAYYNQNRFDEAIDAWDLALIWNTENTDAQTWLERGQQAKHVRQVNDLLAKGKEQYQASNFVDAMATCQAVLAIDSTNGEAQALYHKATDDFTAFIFTKTGQSSELSGYFQAGAKEFVQGNYPGAVDNWRKVLEKSPDNPEARQLTNQAKTRTAETIARGLIEIDSHLRAGRPDLALRVSDRLLKLAPDDKNLAERRNAVQAKIREVVDVHTGIGKDKFNRGDYLSAEKEFRLVLAYDPNNQAAANYLDRVDERLKKNDVGQLYRMGIEAYTQERYDVAIKFWQQVLKITPNNKDCIRNIERARLKLKAIGQ